MTGLLLFMGCGALFFSIKNAPSKPSEPVRFLALTGAERRPLTPEVASELFGLSSDHPILLDGVDLAKIEASLDSISFLKEAKVRKWGRDSLELDVTLRSPIALHGDYVNRGIDVEGTTFPLSPIYTPKKLPLIYTGTERIEGQQWEVVQALLSREDISIEAIDVTHLLSPSLGQREVVLMLKGHYLRLQTRDFPHQISSYHELVREGVLPEGAIIDLRLDHMAFIQRTP